VAAQGSPDAGDIVEISDVVAVAANAIGRLPFSVRNIRNRLMEALQLIGNAGAVFVIVSFAEAGNEPRLTVLALCRDENARVSSALRKISTKASWRRLFRSCILSLAFDQAAL